MAWFGALISLGALGYWWYQGEKEDEDIKKKTNDPNARKENLNRVRNKRDLKRS